MSDSLAQYETLERYETVLKHIRDGVYTLDANGQITWVNETAVEEFDIGYDRADLIGAPVSKVLSEEDIEKCVEIIQRCLQSDELESGRCEISLQTAYGGQIPCDLHLALLPFENGEFQGTVGVVRDITKRKHREQQLEVQNRILRHNLRNDMTVILGHAVELERSVDESLKHHAATIQETGERLVDLSEKVQSLSRIKDLREDEAAAVEIRPLVESILDEYREAHPDVAFDLDVANTDGRLTRIGSQDLFEVSMQNLLENSIEHNEASQPRVTVEIDTDGPRHSVRVRDNGPGVPEEERLVLERGEETELQHSSGLGLWLVRWCVTGVGGSIRFDGTASESSVVTLEFPAHD